MIPEQRDIETKGLGYGSQPIVVPFGAQNVILCIPVLLSLIHI